MMGGTSGFALVPPPCPKSLPVYPDLYRKRRELAKVQMLEREIGTEIYRDLLMFQVFGSI